MESLERLKDRCVLVTGGAGFIGGYLVEMLLRKKYRVVVADIQKPTKSYFFLNRLNKRVEYHRIDITKNTQVKLLFSKVHPSYVIHLAALVIVPEAYSKPREVFQTNIMGTVNLLESCRHTHGIKGILVASSDKAYGKTISAYTEHSPLKGDHPYDVSKSCEDLIAQTYVKTYGLPIVITRFGNVYGGGDTHFDRIVPGICKSIITHIPLEIRSDGTFVRDYIYVKDVANACLFLLEKMPSVTGEAFNIASKTTYSVLNLVKRAKEILRKPLAYTIIDTEVNEIPYQHLNDSKIRKLGWRNSYPFEKAIRETYLWYKRFYTVK